MFMREEEEEETAAAGAYRARPGPAEAEEAASGARVARRRRGAVDDFSKGRESREWRNTVNSAATVEMARETGLIPRRGDELGRRRRPTV